MASKVLTYDALIRAADFQNPFFSDLIRPDVPTTTAARRKASHPPVNRFATEMVFAG